MKRVCVLCLLSLGIAACAGNPPQWWNPGNRYGQTAATSSQQASAPAAKRQAPVVSEEALDPLPDNSYEEEMLTPLPEEEDTPSAETVTEPALDLLPAPSVLE